MKKIALILFIILQMFLPSFAKEQIKLDNSDYGVWVFKINTKKYGKNIKPYMTKTLTTPKKVRDKNCFDLVVNGGFFDPKNGKSVSYVTIDKQMVSKVEDNLTLVENLEKENRLEKVLSRAELRILENKKGELIFDIAYHNDEITNNKYVLKHALQAGPMLYPTMDLVKEGFVVYEDGIVKSQSVDILKRRERTAIALKGKYLYIFLFTNAHKVDANEMRDYILKKTKANKILALDGGLSTALNYKDVQIGSLGNKQRKVKSFLIIERNK